MKKENLFVFNAGGERERERSFFFKKRTPKLVVSKWGDLIFLKRSKRSFPLSRPMENKIHSLSPHKEPSLKQRRFKYSPLFCNQISSVVIFFAINKNFTSHFLTKEKMATPLGTVFSTMRKLLSKLMLSSLDQRSSCSLSNSTKKNLKNIFLRAQLVQKQRGSTTESFQGPAPKSLRRLL